MMNDGTSSAVLIDTNEDDYLAPSQACVNPLFQPQQPAQQAPAAAHRNGMVVAKKRRRKQRIAPPPPSSTSPLLVDETPRHTTTKKDPITASLADCLACSGCVTTAETVLVEKDHSLTAIFERLKQPKPSNSIRAVTISPASWADLCRHFQLQREGFPLGEMMRKLAQMLYETMQVDLVIDGNLPLRWSLECEAQEFVRLYREKQQNPGKILPTPPPSIALNAHQDQVVLNNQVTTVPAPPTFANQVPLISGACPAVVCLVEKSMHALVPHLAAAPSPMTAMGSILGQHYLQQGQNVEHWAIMPCHDKKLEASRKDFVNAQGKPQVNLVLTTSEFVKVLDRVCSRQDSSAMEIDGQEDAQSSFGYDYLQSFAPANILQDALPTTMDAIPAVVATSTATVASPSPPAENNPVFALGSGGHADYIFRHACHQLFGHVVGSEENPWQKVAAGSSSNNNNNKPMSARVAAARSRDSFQAILYRNPHTNAFSTSKGMPEDVPVLRFAIAQGMQTLQRVLNNNTMDFDYVEAMACPTGGCLNGGGQQRIGSASSRERPSETRSRVQATQALLSIPTVTPATSGSSPALLPTRYHVVPPLQHTMGAAAGVAVQDTQW